jgi:galactofuranosylgalactofuranosylrhamnosyl-N-acetylglucosaminyl-diphospho-decaprenol beta-1,5/1,6-galactofuranosyltransferase
VETLHNIVLPNLHVPGHQALYVRLNDRALCELGQPRVCFSPGGEVTTDTFYSGLTTALWKNRCPVQRLFLQLEGNGEFVLSMGLHRLGCETRWLSERPVQLASGFPHSLALPEWQGMPEGMLFFKLRAVSTGHLDRACYQTTDRAPNDVGLGLAITHFNRQALVLPAIERIRRDVLRSAQARGRISLTVVDNSQNLALAPGDDVTHIPNRNLGGSGGFARALLALEEDPRVTHVLFMDDDASCEAESILRTFASLRFAASPQLAVAGALLDESESWRLLEKGACFDGKCRPLHAGRDVRLVHELLLAEQHRATPDYGGWWFFAFPIHAVKRYPFPFFVRGDDVFFSLDNRFEILTLNGVACLAEDFSVKHGPMTAYLDSRYHLLHAVLSPENRSKLIRRLVNNHFFKPLMGYHYASARAFTLALRHVTQGPEFFRANIDIAPIRAEIGAWTPSEKMQSVREFGLKAGHPPARKEKPLRAVLRVMTLQGFLLPQALLSKRLLVHRKTFYGRASDVFRHRRVLYEHGASDTGFIAEHNRALFFQEVRALSAALRAFIRQIPRLQEEYQQNVAQLTSRGFWQEIYSQELRLDEQRRASASRLHGGATSLAPAEHCMQRRADP